MANPPITIGPFANVPAPGSPIRSDWPQEITTDVVALLDRQPNRWSVAGTGGTSGGTFANIQVLNVPSQPVAGSVIVWSYCTADFNGGSAYTFELRKDGVMGARQQLVAAHLAAGSRMYINLQLTLTLAASTPMALTLHGTGTANITLYSDGTVNRMDAIFIPNQFTAT